MLVLEAPLVEADLLSLGFQRADLARIIQERPTG